MVFFNVLGRKPSLGAPGKHSRLVSAKIMCDILTTMLSNTLTFIWVVIIRGRDISTSSYEYDLCLLPALFEGLIFKGPFRGAYLRREICVSKSIGLAL